MNELVLNPHKLHGIIINAFQKCFYIAPLLREKENQWLGEWPSELHISK